MPTHVVGFGVWPAGDVKEKDEEEDGSWPSSSSFSLGSKYSMPSGGLLTISLISDITREIICGGRFSEAILLYDRFARSEESIVEGS